MYLHASNDLQCIKTSRSAKWWEHIEIRLKSQKETGTNSEVFYQRASRCHQKCSPSPRAIGIGHLCLKTSTLRDWRPPAIFRNGGWNLFSTAPVIHQVQFFPIDHQSLWFFRIRPPQHWIPSHWLTWHTKLGWLTTGVRWSFSWCGMICTKRCLWWRYMKYRECNKGSIIYEVFKTLGTFLTRGVSVESQLSLGF